MRRILCGLCAAFLIPATPAVHAQTPTAKPAVDVRGLAVDFARGPAVGDKLPEGVVYNSDGKKTPLSSLKGSHTVLVFGCLT